MEEANQLLEEYWIDAYNQPFAKEPAEQETRIDDHASLTARWHHVSLQRR